MARGMLIWGYLISSPIDTADSKPAKHHQIMHMAAKNDSGVVWEMKSGGVMKVGRRTLGTIVRNQMRATPQKKNIDAFCTRPESPTPKTLTIVKPATTNAASTASSMGRSMPRAKKIVLK